MKWLTSQPLLGMDLGHRTLKGVQLKKIKEQVFVEKIIFQDFSQEPGFPNNINLSEHLDSIATTHSLKKHKTHISLPDEEASNFEMVLPDMPDEDLHQIVKTEISKRIDHPIESACFDFFKLNRFMDHSKKLVTLKVFNTSPEAVVHTVSPFKQAQLKVFSLDVNILSIAAALEYNEYTNENSNYVVLDLGESHTTTAFLVGPQVLFFNSLPIGFGNVNETLKNEKNISYSEAEELKMNTPLIALSKAVENENHLSCRMALIEILTSIQQTIDYYKVHSKDAGIDKIFITGGGSLIKDYRNNIEMYYSIETEIINPFKKLDTIKFLDPQTIEKLEFYNHFMTPAVGLALRGLAA